MLRHQVVLVLVYLHSPTQVPALKATVELQVITTVVVVVDVVGGVGDFVVGGGFVSGVGIGVVLLLLLALKTSQHIRTQHAIKTNTEPHTVPCTLSDCRGFVFRNTGGGTIYR
jgi:hypothetical protein